MAAHFKNECQIRLYKLRREMGYCPDTGVISWRDRSARKGDWGSPDGNGYLKGKFDGVMIFAHRAAWAIHYGAWPDLYIDHIDGDRSNNRIANLRQVTVLENQRNMKLSRANTSGFAGVSFINAQKKWRAVVSNTYLGMYESREDAHEAVKKYREANGFHALHGKTLRQKKKIGSACRNS